MTKILKKISVLFILIIMAIVLTSCMESIEINEMAIVTAVGIDVEGEKIIITAEVIDPRSESKEENDAKLSGVMYVQGEGKTPYEAIRNTGLFFDRNLLFGHSNIIIFGEEFARSGITDVMDFFLRDHGPREGAYLLVAKDAKAYEILGVNTGIEQATGGYLHGVLDNFKYNGKCISISMTEYLRYYYDKNNEVVIGTVEKIEKPEIDINKKKDDPIKYFLDVSGGAAFNKDRLVGYFTENEMIGFNFIVGDMKEALINFKVPTQDNLDKKIIGSHKGYTTVRVLRSLTKKDIIVKEDSIHLEINVYLRVGIVEVNQALDISKSKVINDIEKACSKRVEKLIQNTMEKGKKEFKQDNFSTSVLIHEQHPELWREIEDNWHSIFQDISYSINVKPEIVKSGIINIPMNLKEGN